MSEATSGGKSTAVFEDAGSGNVRPVYDLEEQAGLHAFEHREVDPLNAAIDATAGEVEPEPQQGPEGDILDARINTIVTRRILALLDRMEKDGLIPKWNGPGQPLGLPPWVQPTGGSGAAENPEQNAAAMQAYIDEGVRHATAHFGSAEVVSVAAFREALGKLMEHLHLDHPENYLPKG